MVKKEMGTSVARSAPGTRIDAAEFFDLRETGFSLSASPREMSEIERIRIEIALTQERVRQHPMIFGTRRKAKSG